MADTSIKFGVVTGAPSSLTAEKIQQGKLYFLAGEKNGNIKQGIYGVDPLTSDPSSGVFNLAMFGTGAVADGTGYGLSQYNFDSDASTKLKNLYDASANYLLKTSYVQVDNDSSGYVPMADDSAGIIDSQAGDWVLTFDGSKVDWYKLPENAFKNDNSIYTGTSPINVDGTTISHANSGVTAGGYGDSSGTRTLAFGDKFKVADVSVNEFGHVTKASSYELTLPDKPSTAGIADEAKKTTGTLTIKGNGTSVGTFNGSAAEEVNIISGSASTLTVTGTADGSITITPKIAAVTSNSDALTTGAQVASYVADVVGDLTGALVYKGTVNAANGLPSNASTGWVYVASAGFTYNDGTNDWAVESGDMFIYNGSKWNIVNGENQVDNKNATLSIGGSKTIATVDGTDIVVSLPSSGYYTHPAAGEGSVDTPTNSSTAATLLTRIKIDSSGHVTDTTVFNGTVGGTSTPIYFNAGVPTALGYTIATSVPSGAIFTDEKVKANTSTGKIYLVGQDDSTNGTTKSVYKNASVYMQSGKMYATSGSVASNDTALVTGGTVYTAVEAAKEAATIYWETL